MSLREAIRERGLKQRDVAKKAGVSEAALSHWCSRRYVIPATKAMLLYREFGIPLASMRPDLWPADIHDPSPAPKQAA